MASPAVRGAGALAVLVVALAALYLSPLGDGLREGFSTPVALETDLETEAPSPPRLPGEPLARGEAEQPAGSEVEVIVEEERELAAPLVPEAARELTAPAPSTPRIAPPLPPDGTWVRALALTHVHVRNAPGVSGEIVGRVTVDDVVLLGGSAGSWRPIRTRSDGQLTGWVWGPFFREMEGGS
jgi:hypothetical protein